MRVLQMIYRVYVKRILDFLFALIILPFVCLIIIVVSPFIYLTDKGSVFYIAKRIGQNGQIFKIFKLRTMITNAPDIRLEDGSTYNSFDDPRLTKVGKILRKTSIDELPQIINVLIGDMSLIGPRPDPIDWLERYTDTERVFLKVKPGITGYNQAYFRNSADGSMKLVNDVFYAKKISFKLDVKILLKTLRTILLRENLYINDNRK
jgi:undecaprenyl phosphate N,N'-diacetylbacillosamine 1-phosphate transferase